MDKQEGEYEVPEWRGRKWQEAYVAKKNIKKQDEKTPKACTFR